MRNEVRIKVGKIFNKIDKIARSGKDYQIEYKNYIDELVQKGDYESFQLCIETLYDIDPRSYKTVNELKNLTWPLILQRTSSSFVERLKKLYKSNGIYQQGDQLKSDNILNAIFTLSDTLDSNYAIVATSSKVEFTRTDDILNIDIIDTNLYNIDISTVDWSNDVPRFAKPLQSLTSGSDYFTQSSYATQIPLTHGGTYLINVEKRDDYGKFSYRLEVERDDTIGTITEVLIDNYLESNYYYKNKQLAEILGYKKTFLEVKKVGQTDVLTIMHNDPAVSEEMNLYQRYIMAIDYLLS